MVGAPPRNLVEVRPRDGIVPRVEPVAHRVDAQDVDVGGQGIVHPSQQRCRRHVRPDIEVRDLCERVDARVGAPGAVQLELASARGIADSPIELALHRARVLLDLPAAVARARVLEGELESRHVFQAPGSSLQPPARRV